MPGAAAMVTRGKTMALVVDDDAVCRLFCAIRCPAGCRVSNAAWQGAIICCARSQLILMDLQLARFRDSTSSPASHARRKAGREAAHRHDGGSFRQVHSDCTSRMFRPCEAFERDCWPPLPKALDGPIRAWPGTQRWNRNCKPHF
jgi:hypothetical protein